MLKTKSDIVQGRDLRTGKCITIRSKDTILSAKKSDIVQARNPRTGKYIKIDRSKGVILSAKKSEGPYKGVPVARRRSS